MQINIYRRPHDEKDEELVLSGDMHPSNLGYWMGELFQFDCDLRLEILGDGNEKQFNFDEDGEPVLEEDVIGTVH